MLWRKQQFTSGGNVFLREEKVSLMKRDQDGQQQAELKKTCKNSSNCAWKSSADCQEHNTASEHWQRNSYENLNWISWCVKKWSQMSSPKNKSKEKSQFAKTFWRGKTTFWAMSSQVMKHGSTNTTLKRSGKVHNGRVPIPHDQKNSIGLNQESKQCCWLFFILEGLFIMNLYQLDKESTNYTIWKYWKGRM